MSTPDYVQAISGRPGVVILPDTRNAVCQRGTASAPMITTTNVRRLTATDVRSIRCALRLAWFLGLEGKLYETRRNMPKP